MMPASTSLYSKYVRLSARIVMLYAIALSVIVSPVSAGPIYVIKERDGSLRFTNKAPAPGQDYQKFTAKQGSVSWVRGGHGYRGKLFPNTFDEIIQRAAERHGLSPHLIRAVIHAESGFNARALSPKGARGLMQLMPQTARELGVKNSFDPDENIHGGSRYLAFLLERYRGDLRKSLAAYNAGPGAVDQYRGIPPYSETRSYIERVMALKTRYATHTRAKS